MRRLFLASTLVIASCAPRPQQGSMVVVPSQPTARVPGALNGMTVSEVVAKLGTPALQIHEGTSLKLQFRSPVCVLDAYFYPSAGAQLRVTHVDARAPSGADMDQATCIFRFENPI